MQHFLKQSTFTDLKIPGLALSSVSEAEKVQFILYAFVVIKHNLPCFQPQLLNFPLLPFVHFKCVTRSILLVEILKTSEYRLFSWAIETIFNGVISCFTKLPFLNVYFTHEAH